VCKEERTIPTNPEAHLELEEVDDAALEALAPRGLAQIPAEELAQKIKGLHFIQGRSTNTRVHLECRFHIALDHSNCLSLKTCRQVSAHYMA